MKKCLHIDIEKPPVKIPSFETPLLSHKWWSEQFVGVTECECRDKVDAANYRVRIDKTKSIGNIILIKKLQSEGSLCIPPHINICVSLEPLDKQYIHPGWSRVCSSWKSRVSDNTWKCLAKSCNLSIRSNNELSWQAQIFHYHGRSGSQ